jgi:hypothetical protein
MVNKRFWLVILVLTLVFGMIVVGCEEEKEDPPPSGSKSISGTATTNDTGDIYFSFYRDNGGAESCDFTTDLPAPNDAFTLADDEWKNIYSLTPNQKVKWTATVATGLIEQSSGNPVYSVRVNTVK